MKDTIKQLISGCIASFESSTTLEPAAPNYTMPALSLPEATAFRLLPIFDKLGQHRVLDDCQVQEQMTKLRGQLGENRTHFKVGFSSCRLY